MDALNQISSEKERENAKLVAQKNDLINSKTQDEDSLINYDYELH